MVERWAEPLVAAMAVPTVELTDTLRECSMVA